MGECPDSFLKKQFLKISNSCKLKFMNSYKLSELQHHMNGFCPFYFFCALISMDQEIFFYIYLKQSFFLTDFMTILICFYTTLLIKACIFKVTKYNINLGVQNKKQTKTTQKNTSYLSLPNFMLEKLNLLFCSTSKANF